VARWAAFPPGANCHEYYGGIRGQEPTGDLVGSLRKDFSADPANPKEPIIGKGVNPFPFAAQKTINLDPDNVAAAQRERVESQAIVNSVRTEGKEKKGLAGILFSPSVIGGDSYAIEAALPHTPYARNLGFVSRRPVEPAIKGRTGTMVVWRLAQITKSWRKLGEADALVANRDHPGDGRGMSVKTLNDSMKLGFTEWEFTEADHTDVALDTYKNFFNTKAANQGFFNGLATQVTAFTDYFVHFDPHRVALPQGIPPGDLDKAKRIARAAINRTPDVATEADPGGPTPAIPVSGHAQAAYIAWVKGKCKKAINDFMTGSLNMSENPPRSMQVLRWPMVYRSFWSDGLNTTSELSLAGYCRGDRMAFFNSDPAEGNPDTFEHEFGHSLYLTHFATGSATNFCWKHHDYGYQQCKMGYYNSNNNVPGTALNIATGNRADFCGKCLLKLRGWKEDRLPFKWDDPNVF
jgi:hypothetical protein